MKVYLNSITGMDDAIVSMYMSKRTWTRELEMRVREDYYKYTHRNGRLVDSEYLLEEYREEYEWFTKQLKTCFKWGKKHFTMLRFADVSFTVEGLHRGGQDDWDSHAKRFDNRIIRSSTRLATYEEGELSEWYKDKIIPTDIALVALGLSAPEKVYSYKGKLTTHLSEIEHLEHQTFVKTANGYILEEMQNNKDVKRGLYMLSIPSNFLCKVNITELAHCIKERDDNGTANPEVKLFVEDLLRQITEWYPLMNRELFYEILN